MAKHQPSSIDRLPEDIRTQLQELLRDPRVTQLDATARINAILAEENLAPISKSAVNRYAVRMAEVGAKLRETREVAQMWIGKLGSEPAGEVGKLLNELVRTLAFRAAMRASETDDDAIDPKLLKSLAISVHRLERAAVDNAALQEKIRKQERERLAKKTIEAVDAAAADAPTADRLKAAIREVYGV